jgi:hypothetical protein
MVEIMIVPAPDRIRSKATEEAVEDALDQALEDTFPASDPIAVLQPTFIGAASELVPGPRGQAAGQDSNLIRLRPRHCSEK